MLPRGFLGTRADVLVDLIIVSLALIIPMLLVSYLRVKRREYQTHKRIQLTLASILAVAVLCFEIDLRISGGAVALTRGSRFEGSAFLNGSIYFHLIFSVSTAVIWTWLTLTSLRRFSRPPKPGPFSPTHRFWGRIAMLDLVMTGLTGIELYIIGFAL